MSDQSDHRWGEATALASSFCALDTCYEQCFPEFVDQRYAKEYIHRALPILGR